MKDNNFKTIKNIIALLVSGASAIVFSLLFINTFNDGVVFERKTTVIILAVILLTLIAAVGVVCLFKNNQTVYKCVVLTLIAAAIVLITLYILKISGALEKISSVEQLRSYVASFGVAASIIYVALNVLQVVVLPIPGFVAIATGVALFGPLKASIYSFIGIMIGSITAFFIGKKLGYKVVVWLVGKETLDKWLNAVKNKDRIVLTFMFLFPLFPDDVLCFVAGLSSMTTPYFIIMITICRIISIVVTSYSLNGNLIPYNTWWGVLTWGVIILITVAVTVLLYKHGDKIEKKIVNFLKSKFRRNKSGKDDSSRRLK